MTTASSFRTPTVLLREIVLGSDEQLTVEVVVAPYGDETWVLLRAPNEELTPVPQRHALGSAFEYVATILRHEFVYLRKLPDNLRFFHVTYEMVPTGTLQWAVSEVMLLLRAEQYVYGRWTVLDALTTDVIIEALNLLGPPKKKPLHT